MLRGSRRKNKINMVLLILCPLGFNLNNSTWNTTQPVSLEIFIMWPCNRPLAPPIDLKDWLTTPPSPLPPSHLFSYWSKSTNQQLFCQQQPINNNHLSTISSLSLTWHAFQDAPVCQPCTALLVVVSDSIPAVFQLLSAKFFTSHLPEIIRLVAKKKWDKIYYFNIWSLIC